MSQLGPNAADSIGRSSGVSPALPSLVDRAKRYMWSHIDEPLRQPEIAAAVRCSRTYLARLFVRETGETMHEHLERVRLLIALNEIRAGGKTTAVAYGVGFRSYGRFVRAFRKGFSADPRTFQPRSSEKPAMLAGSVPIVPTPPSGSSMKAPHVEIVIRARQPAVAVDGKLADVDIIFGAASCLHGLALEGFEVMVNSKRTPGSISFPTGHFPDAEAGSSGLRVLSAVASQPLREAMLETARALGRDPRIECAYEKRPGESKLHRLVFN